MIRPIPEEPIRLGGGPLRRPHFDAESPTRDSLWEDAYYRKLAEFAAETRRTSILMRGLLSLGCRASGAHEGCLGCSALRMAGAIDPPADAPAAADEDARVRDWYDAIPTSGDEPTREEEYASRMDAADRAVRAEWAADDDELYVEQTDEDRLASGETCVPGMPMSCGDAHTAGHCVKPDAPAAATCKCPTGFCACDHDGRCAPQCEAPAAAGVPGTADHNGHDDGAEEPAHRYVYGKHDVPWCPACNPPKPRCESLLDMPDGVTRYRCVRNAGHIGAHRWDRDRRDEWVDGDDPEPAPAVSGAADDGGPES